MDENKGNWRDQAECRNAPLEFFFPEKGGSGIETASRAKQYCNVCPVSNDCLAYAVEADIEFGIYGGMTRNTRRRTYTKRALREGTISLA